MMPNLKLYWVRKVNVKSKILLVSFRYASNDTLAIRYEESIRVCDYSLALEDKNILRLGYKDGICRYHEVFDTKLLTTIMNNNNITQIVGLKANQETCKVFNKAEAADFIIRNFSQEQP